MPGMPGTASVTASSQRADPYLFRPRGSLSRSWFELQCLPGVLSALIMPRARERDGILCLLTCLAADEIKIRRPPIYKRTAREINADLEACGNSLAASSVPPLAFGNEPPKAFVFSRSLDAVDSTPFASIGRSEPRLRASLKRPSDRKLWSSIDCPFGDDKVPTTRVQVLSSLCLPL